MEEKKTCDERQTNSPGALTARGSLAATSSMGVSTSVISGMFLFKVKFVVQKNEISSDSGK